MKKQSKKCASWESSEALWAVAKDLIPQKQRDPELEYRRAQGAGRKPLDSKFVFDSILYILRTGAQWKSIKSGSAVHRYFCEWAEAKFFENLWIACLGNYDELIGIDWEWLSIDSSSVKAPLALESVGPNPTDRGKKWKQTPHNN